MSCNVVDVYVSFCKKCNIKYMRFFMNRYYNRDIFKEFYDIYENVRYFNMYPMKQKSVVSNINYYLKNKCDSLLEVMDSPKDIIVIKDTYYFFKYLMYFDGVKRFDNDINVVLSNLINDMYIRYSNIDVKELTKEFNSMYKEDLNKKNSYLLKFDSKDFELIFKRCNIKNVYDVSLSDNIKIPKLYSKYAIDRVRNSSVISEDLFNVTIYMLSKDILLNIISCNFDKEYLLSFNFGIWDKVDKFKRILNIIDNDISREFICFKISYKDFNIDRDRVYDLTRKGYYFCVCIDLDDEIDAVEYQKLGVFKYISVVDSDKRFSRLDNVIVRK